MRGLDTNILVRYLTADDSSQSPQARTLIERAEAEGEKLFVSVVVQCELVWTLRGPRFGLDRAAIADALEGMIAAPVFIFQDRDLALRAVRDYRRGPADFSDYLMGRHNQRAGCRDTVTFDRKLAKETRFVLLEAR